MGNENEQNPLRVDEPQVEIKPYREAEPKKVKIRVTKGRSRSLQRDIISRDSTGKILRRFTDTSERFMVGFGSELRNKYEDGWHYYTDAYTKEQLKEISEAMCSDYNKTVRDGWYKHELVSFTLVNQNIEQELKEEVLKFMKEQEVTCEESVYQTDRVIENAYDFIANLYNIVKEEVIIEEDE